MYKQTQIRKTHPKYFVLRWGLNSFEWQTRVIIFQLAILFW